MKGVNASKIVTLAAGAVLLCSSAIAATASYENVELVSPSGQVNAKIVVGSSAQISDGIAAANIASVLANYAYKSSTLYAELSGEPTCSATGTISGAGTCEVSNEKVTIEITVPGEIANAHQFKTLITDTIDRTLANRNSTKSEDHYNASMGTNDVNTVLSPLRSYSENTASASRLYRISGSQFSGFKDKVVTDPQAGADFAYTAEQGFWVGSSVDAVVYDSGSAYRQIVAKPRIAAYNIRFLGNDYGIPFCTQVNQTSADGDWRWCTSDTSSQYRTDNHRVKIPFLGSEWIISSMSLPSTVLASATNATSGGQVKLAKEAKYDIINVGGVIDGGDFKVRLADISVATGAANIHPAILDVLDANDAVVGQVQVNPGDTYTFTQSSTGKTIKVHVYRTAPGFTLSAKWAEIAIYTDEITLQDGQRYNLVSSGDANYNWKVELGWKNRDWTSAASSNNSDSLREIVLYDEDSFIGKKMVAGDIYNFPKEDTGFRMTYNGLDLTDSDYVPVTITALTSTDYPVSNASSSADCTDTANRITYNARLLQFKTDGNYFGGSTSNLIGNYRLDAFYYDPVGGVSNVSAGPQRDCDGAGTVCSDTLWSASTAFGNFSIDTGASRYNGTQAYRFPELYINASVTGWAPAILYRPSGFSCYINKSVTTLTVGVANQPTGATMPMNSTNTVAFDTAGADSGAYGMFIFSNYTTRFGPSGVNSTFFYQEDAGKNDTTSHVPVFLQLPFINSSDTWRFRSTDSSTATVYYHGIRDSVATATTGWTAYEPTLVTERGSKVTSVGTTDIALQVANKIGMPAFTFSYADAELADSGELWEAEEGDEKTLSNGIKLKVKSIDQTVGSCVASTGEGATPSCTVNTDPVTAKIMPNNAASVQVIESYDIRQASDLVIFDAEAGSAGGVVVTVGGPIVNSVTADVLQDANVDFDVTNVYVKAFGSKIVVAGKTAADTMAAADEFINALQKS
ncbi:MAG: hypothetical protein ABIH83_03590 [Candidatus Micrarchaeota archaeon]